MSQVLILCFARNKISKQPLPSPGSTYYCEPVETGWRYRGPKRLGITLAVGSLSGILIAATSMGNPPVIAYFLSGPDTAATNRANFTGYFAITLATLIVMMTAKGLINGATVLRTASLLPVFAGAAWLGAKYFYKSTDRRYRQVALGLLICVAVYGILR